MGHQDRVWRKPMGATPGETARVILMFAFWRLAHNLSVPGFGNVPQKDRAP
jgi:hypothetical protein